MDLDTRGNSKENSIFSCCRADIARGAVAAGEKDQIHALPLQPFGDGAGILRGGGVCIAALHDDTIIAKRFGNILAHAARAGVDGDAVLQTQQLLQGFFCAVAGLRHRTAAESFLHHAVAAFESHAAAKTRHGVDDQT